MRTGVCGREIAENVSIPFSFFWSEIRSSMTLGARGGKKMRKALPSHLPRNLPECETPMRDRQVAGWKKKRMGGGKKKN